jgi:hypothetical protein
MSWTRLELVKEFRAMLPKAPPTAQDVANAAFIFGLILAKARDVVAEHGGHVALPPEVDCDPVAFFARPEFQPLREAAALFEQHWQANIPASEIIRSLAADRAAADRDWMERDLARGGAYFHCAHALATADAADRPALMQVWIDHYVKSAKTYRDNLAAPVFTETPQAAAAVTVHASPKPRAADAA